jgi:hypothetical protein
MKQIIVKKNGQVSHSSGPKTDVESQNWLQKHLQEGNFGEEFTYEVLDISNVLQQKLINDRSLEFLRSTDWKIIRHRDQVDSGIDTSLSREEYEILLKDRQSARDSVVSINSIDI